jgi:hypothetical protein
MSIAHIGNIIPLDQRKKMSDASIGKKKSISHRANIARSQIGKISPMLGKQHSAQSKIKMRLARINQISKNIFDGNQIIPGWNEMACQKIDEYGKQNGYNFQHAMNGGEYFISELGYWVDGYDNEKNVVVEYYEKWHSKQKEKDLNRQKEICKHLNCNFIILNENDNTLSGDLKW